MNVGWKYLYAIAELHLYLEEPRTADNTTDNEYAEVREFTRYFKSKHLMTERKYRERKKKLAAFVQTYKPKVFFLEGTTPKPLVKEIYDGEIVLLDKGLKEYYALHALEIAKMKRVLEIFNDFSAGRSTKEEAVSAICKAVEKLEKLKSDLSMKREKHWVDKVIQRYKEPSAVLCGAFHLSDGLVNRLKLVRHFPKDIFHWYGSNEKTIFVKELKSACIKTLVKEIFI